MPALCLFTWALQDSGNIAWVATLFFAVSIALRLARFDSELPNPADYVANYFTGIPAPAAGFLVLMPIVIDLEFGLEVVRQALYVSIWLVLIGAGAVSTLPSFAGKKLKLPVNTVLPVLALVGLLGAAIVTEHGQYGAVIVSAENHMYDTSALKIPPRCEMLLLQNEMRSGVFSVCAAAARKQGARVVWNTAPASDVSLSDLALVDTLIVNRVEAADILDRSDVGADPVAAVRLLSALAPNAEIIITLGGEGVVFAAPGQPCEIQPAHSVKVVSTHGAGDVFVGTFAAGRLKGLSLSQAVAAGQKAAAAHIAQSR